MDLFDDSEKFTLPFEIPEIEGYSIEKSNFPIGHRVTLPNGNLFYSENFFGKKLSDRCLEYFQENEMCDWKSDEWRKVLVEDFPNINFQNINWKQDSIKLYGKSIPLPRLTAWYGDDGKTYSYSGISSNPNPWNKGLLHLKSLIEENFGEQFNSVLLNWYRNGEDYLNWHSDNEKELGINPTIASVNFGETRDFVIRNKNDKSVKITIPLKHGTLLIMSGEMQHFWEHCVPKRKKSNGSRFNLTFRFIKTFK